MEENKMISERNQSLIALLGAFVLAIVHQYLFYGKLPGVSFPIFVSLFYLYMFYFAKDRLRNTSWIGWLLFVIIILLSFTYFLFNNPFFYVMNFLVIPPLIFIHMAFMLSSRRVAWSDIRLIVDALDHLIPQSFRHWPTIFRILKSPVKKAGDQQKYVIGKILVGLAIALPLLIAVISLLASADGVFDHFLSAIPNWLNDISFGDGIERVVWICFFCFVFFGYVRGFVDQKKYEWEREEADGARERKSAKIDPIIIATVLIAINIVYVLFVIIQFSYLFGAWQGMLPEGKSYAEYARSGFFELVTVSIINFVIMIGTLVYGGKTLSALQKINNIMLYILVGCSFVMLYSAYIRLVLYEQAYGYTYIRFLVHAFMIYLGILLIIAGFRIRFYGVPLARCYIVISLLAYVLINYVGMDTIIAGKNIERYRESGKIDEHYLSGLSTDATPLLIRFSREEYPKLKEDLHENWMDLSRTDREWPSFNLSHYRAQSALENYFAE